MDKASQRALKLVNQPKGKPMSLAAFLMMVVISAFLLFVVGMFLGAPLLQWWREASTRQEQALAAPGPAEEIKLLDEAAIYTLFWDKRVSRLQKAAARFGWNELQLAKAYHLIETAKPRFQAVEIGYLGWSQSGITYELLKREVDGLYEQLALTFCEEFNLVCMRGVPPDQATPKRAKTVRPSSPFRKNLEGFSLSCRKTV